MTKKYGAWISVKEQLPPMDMPVLALNAHNHLCVAMRIMDCDSPCATDWLWGIYEHGCFDISNVEDGFFDSRNTDRDYFATWIGDEGYSIYDITHWMPLPELLKRSES